MNKIKTFSDYINESNTEFSKYSAINEEDNPILAYFKSVKNYSKISKEYQTLKQEIIQQEIDKANERAALDDKADEKAEGFEDKMLIKIRKQASQMKETKKRQAFRAGAEKAIAAKLTAFKEQLKAKIDLWDKKTQSNIDAMNGDLGKLDSEYPMTEPLSSQWAQEKIQLNHDFEYKLTLAKNAIIMQKAEESGDPDKLKDAQARTLDREKKLEASLKDELTAAKGRAEEKKAAWDAKLQNAKPEEKDGIQKLSALTAAMSNYASVAQATKDTIDSDESTPEEIKTANGNKTEANKKLDDANKEVTKKVLKSILGDDAKAEAEREDLDLEIKEIKEAFSKSKTKTDDVEKVDLDSVDDGTKSDFADQAAKDAAIAKAEGDITTATTAIATQQAIIDDANATPEAKAAATTKKTEEEGKKSAAESAKSKAESGVVGESDDFFYFDDADVADYTSTDSSNFEKSSTLEKKKNVLSFDEFVNESRKNGYTY